MFEVKEPTKLTVKLFGKTAEFPAPSAFELQSMQEKVEAAGKDGKSALGVWVDWLESLGIARESLVKLETKHVFGLIDYVTGAGKN